MPPIPVTKDDITSFQPESLLSLETIPTFRFRPSTKRDGRAFEHALIVEGLALHDKDDLRAAYVAALRAAFDENEADKGVAQFRDLWDRLDQGVEIDPAEIAAAEGLLERLCRVDRNLRTMIADNNAFMRDAPRLAIGLLLVGWSDIPLPFRRIEGVVELADIDSVQAALRKIEDEAVAANIEAVSPGLAFIQLCNHALDLLNLTKEDEGKLPSQSPSLATPSGSKAKRSKTAA